MSAFEDKKRESNYKNAPSVKYWYHGSETLSGYWIHFKCRLIWCGAPATVLLSKRLFIWILGLPKSQCCSSISQSKGVSVWIPLCWNMIVCRFCVRCSSSSDLKPARGIWYVFCDNKMKLQAVWAWGICVWEQIVDMNSLRSFAITSACGFNWLNQQIELIRDF